MIKYLCLLFIFQFISLTAIYSQQIEQSRFSISGKITGRDTGTLVLSYLNSDQKFNIDTAKIEAGKFSFTGRISEATMAYLIGHTTTHLMNDPNRAIIFLEPKKMEMELVEGKFNEVMIKGSKIQREYDRLGLSQIPYKNRRNSILKTIDSLDRLVKVIGKTDSLKKELNNLNVEWKQNNNNFKNAEVRFVLENPGSMISAFILTSLVESRTLSPDSAFRVFTSFSEEVKISHFGRNAKSAIDHKQAVAVGNNAPKFRTKDINGNIITSEQYMGQKYILLDFWASWCAPCHEQAPYLNKLYDRYKGKELEIISISADNNRKM